jgi:hypothetical protein
MHSRILVPVPLILNAKNFGEASLLLKNDRYLENSDINVDMTREIVRQVMLALISESAYEIILVWNDKDLEKQIMEDFPNKLKSRTKSKYLTDIPSNFISTFESIRNDHICSPTLDTLVNELYLLKIACEERTEVDIRSSLNIINNWDDVFRTSKYLKSSPEVEDLLAVLKGWVNVYNYSEKIECFVDTNHEIPIEKRIENFLNDAYINKLSKEKYCFGIPSHVKESVFKFRQLIKKIKKEHLKCAIKGSVSIGFATAQVEKTIFDKQYKYYSPPIAPLKDIYMSKINDYINQNSLKELYLIETMPTYRAGFTFYACNGNEFKPSLVAEGLEFKGEYCLGGNNWVNINLSNTKIGNRVF